MGENDKVKALRKYLKGLSEDWVYQERGTGVKLNKEAFLEKIMKDKKFRERWMKMIDNLTIGLWSRGEL